MFRVFQKIEKVVKFKELQRGTYMLKGVNETFLFMYMPKTATS